MEIITGRTREHHVVAADDAELYRLFLGDGQWVLPTGRKFEAIMDGAYEMHVYHGSLIMQGRLAKIREPDVYDTLEFTPSIAGKRRCDAVVAEYSSTIIEEQKEIEVEGETQTITIYDKVEKIELNVVQGEYTDISNTYLTPEIIEGNIDNGETHQMLLYHVYYEGVNFDKMVSYVENYLLTDTPYQTLLARAEEIESNVFARLAEVEADAYEALDRVIDLSESLKVYARNMTAGIKGQFTTYEQKLTVPTNLIVTPDSWYGYVYSITDEFMVFINGLYAIENTDYEVLTEDEGSTLTGIKFNQQYIGQDVRLVILKGVKGNASGVRGDINVDYADGVVDVQVVAESE